MKLIKLAMICEDLSPEMGGQAVSIPLLGEYLEKIGVKVKYFSGVNSIGYGKTKSSKTHVYFRYRHSKLKFSIGLFHQLWKNRDDIDILHLNNLWNFVPITAYFFAKFTNKPFVISPRGMAIKEEIDRRRLKKLLLRCIFRRILNQASFIHVTSEGEVQSLEALGISNDILRVGHGVKSPIPSPDFVELNGIRAKRRFILFSGRVCRYKNIHKLTEAFRIFSKCNPDWELFIIGPIEDRVYFDEMNVTLNKKNLLSKVKFFGHKGPDELKRYYSNASIFANVSHSENFGLSIAEVLSYGVPCVVPKNSPWKEIDKYKVGVRVDSEALIIARSLEFIADNLLNDEKVFQNAISLVGQYSWDNQAYKIKEGYLSVLSSY